MTVSINGTSTNVTSVYWIRCHDHTDITSQGYVGVSNNVKRRFIEHKRSSDNKRLKRAIQKYGWDNLLKNEIVIANNDYCLELEKKLRPIKNIGWNLTVGGGMPPNHLGKKFNRTIPAWNKGKNYSLETRKKISDAVTIAMQDPARREINRTRQLGNTYRRGISLSAETIQKISQSNKGRISPNKGLILTAEQRKQRSEKIRETSWECPHCQTIGYGIGAKNRWHFDNCIGKRK